MPEYKYKAFISYRHLEPDMQAAEKLQKLLESYKPPKNLGKTKDNWRIFRDVSELQSSSDLSEDIRNAIETSEYLIVICSPKYTESKWCMQELTRFRELHGNTNENIITLLVSGEPQESFPEELTYTEMTTTNEKGEEVTVKVEVEYRVPAYRCASARLRFQRPLPAREAPRGCTQKKDIRRRIRYPFAHHRYQCCLCCHYQQQERADKEAEQPDKGAE